MAKVYTPVVDTHFYFYCTVEFIVMSCRSHVVLSVVKGLNGLKVHAGNSKLYCREIQINISFIKCTFLESIRLLTKMEVIAKSQQHTSMIFLTQKL